MKKFYYTLNITLGLFFSAETFAALPPLYQTLNEYKTLLTSKELTEKLNSADAIVDIKRDQAGFTITTNKHILKVDVVYEKTEMIGPAHFHFNFQDPTSINQEK